MYRLLFSILLEGVVLGVGLALFKIIGQYRMSWGTLIGFLASILFVVVLQSIPVLRLESEFQKLLREAGDDRRKLEKLMGRTRKPLVSPWSWVTVVFLSVLGLIARLLG